MSQDEPTLDAQLIFALDMIERLQTQVKQLVTNHNALADDFAELEERYDAKFPRAWYCNHSNCGGKVREQDKSCSRCQRPIEPVRGR